MSLNTRLTQISIDISSRRKQLREEKDALSKIDTSPIARYNQVYNDANYGYCAGKYSLKSRRRQCQEELNTKLANLKPARDAVIARQNAIKSTISNLEREIQVLETESETISAQLSDSDVIRTTTDSQVQLLTTTQEVEKDKKAIQRRNLFLLGIGAIVLTVIGFYVYKKFIK